MPTVWTNEQKSIYLVGGSFEFLIDDIYTFLIDDTYEFLIQDGMSSTQWINEQKS